MVTGSIPPGWMLLVEHSSALSLAIHSGTQDSFGVVFLLLGKP